MGIRCGVDIVETARIRRVMERQGPRFLRRVFTLGEQADCTGHGSRDLQSLAVRFAAKEAVAKALGTGIGEGASFLDIELIRSEEGSPQVRLHGAAARTYEGIGGCDIAVSLSHEKAYCVAQVVLLTK